MNTFTRVLGLCVIAAFVSAGVANAGESADKASEVAFSDTLDIMLADDGSTSFSDVAVTATLPALLPCKKLKGLMKGYKCEATGQIKCQTRNGPRCLRCVKGKKIDLTPQQCEAAHGPIIEAPRSLLD